MGSILLNEYPLIVLPSLAVKVGLNESIFLQQLHYWLQKSTTVIENRKWIYNTYSDWQKQLPFFSIRTLKRIVIELNKTKIIFVKQLHKDKRIKTNYYSINYEYLQNWHDAECQVGTMESDKMALCTINTKTTTDTILLGKPNDTVFFKNHLLKPPDFKVYNEEFEYKDYEPIENEIIDIKDKNILNILSMVVLKHFNWVTKSRYRPVEANLKLIRIVLSSGVCLVDCYAVNAYKCGKGAFKDGYEQYLRPKTIYAAANFEQYLGAIKTNRERNQ